MKHLTTEHVKAILSHFDRRIEAALKGKRLTREDITETDHSLLRSAETILTGEGRRGKLPKVTEASSFLKRYHSELGEDEDEEESEGYDRTKNTLGDGLPLGTSDPRDHQDAPRNLGKKSESKRLRSAVSTFHRSLGESDRALPNWLG